jgi:hypothetical protein
MILADACHCLENSSIRDNTVEDVIPYEMVIQEPSAY